MLSENAANVTIFPKCASRPLAAWIDELQSDGEMAFYFARPEFVGDVGYALKSMREAAGIRRKTLAVKTGLSRSTIYEVESGGRIGGSPLSVISTYLSGLDNQALVFTLRHYEGGPVIYQPFSAKTDVRQFCASMVRNLRRSAGLTQAELNQRIKLPAALERPDFDPVAFQNAKPKAAPQISAIERIDPAGTDTKRVRSQRLGMLFTIAYFCGYTLGVQQDGVT